MHNKRNDYIKIGKSKNPRFREKTLQADWPDIELIAFWQAPFQMEKELQKRFVDKRKRGEWYDLKLKDFDHIKKLMDPYANGKS